LAREIIAGSLCDRERLLEHQLGHIA